MATSTFVVTLNWISPPITPTSKLGWSTKMAASYPNWRTVIVFVWSAAITVTVALRTYRSSLSSTDIFSAFPSADGWHQFLSDLTVQISTLVVTATFWLPDSLLKSTVSFPTVKLGVEEPSSSEHAVDRHGSNDNRKKSSIYFFILFFIQVRPLNIDRFPVLLKQNKECPSWSLSLRTKDSGKVLTAELPLSCTLRSLRREVLLR